MNLAVNHLPDDPVKLKALLQNSLQREDELKQQIHSLLEALRLEKHRLYGTSSEKSPDQSELFDEADTSVDAIGLGADEQEPAVLAAPSKDQKRSTRKPLPAELPRVQRVIELSDKERQCPCGCMLTEIGEEISEQVDIIPAQIQVIQIIRKKYACKGCEDTIKTAPKPDVLLPKSIASGNTMAYVITSRYADGLPLYRLSGILGRYGIELPRQMAESHTAI
jgi:transposase